MKLMINGNETVLQGDLTVTGLLQSLQIEPARVAVEVNMTIVKRCDFQSHALKDGDNVEIVNFVGGG
ncbi:MAG: sulfur carrier protein ThiS [Nitrospirota bacterium]|nr:sulfur carrier protein ThiS [Nitrospirota bacterium]